MFKCCFGRDAELDQGKNCPSGSYTEGTLYKEIANAMGAYGSVYSVCDTDYAPALDALSKFVTSVTSRSYNFPIKPGTLIEGLVIIRNGAEITPLVGRDVTIKGGSVVFSDTFDIKSDDKIRLEVKEKKI